MRVGVELAESVVVVEEGAEVVLDAVVVEVAATTQPASLN
jgi:hypothetical protein